jgi:hypothetical protein
MIERARRKHHANGLIACDQGKVNGYCLSFNPDTDRYHVHAKNEYCLTLAAFKNWSSAVYYARNRKERD